MSTRIVEPSRAAIAPPAVRQAPAAYSVGWTVALASCDVTMFIAASWLASLIGYRHWENRGGIERLIIAESIFVCLWVVIFAQLGLYRRSFALTIKDELYYTCAALVLGSLPQLLVFTIAPWLSTSRAVILLALPFSMVLVGSTRIVAHALRNSRRFRHSRRVAIVGTSARVEEAFAALRLSETDQALLLAIDDSESIDAVLADGCGRAEDIEWFAQAARWGCTTLILTEMISPDFIPQLLEVAARSQIEFAFAPPRIRAHAYTLSLRTDGEQALLVPSRLRACTPRARLHKRIFDIAFASIALMLFMPAMLVTAIAVLLEDGTPVLYRQERVGINGSLFNMLKFRSMRRNAEAESGAVWAAEGDDRRTRVGAVLRRLSFDELPQFINVLRGDMSLVGPRPERPVFVDLFKSTLPRYNERHLVPPGITGWSQVHMRRLLNPSDAAEKLHYDLQYIEGWSPFLDISVLVQTLFEFLFHKAG